MTAAEALAAALRRYHDDLVTGDIDTLALFADVSAKIINRATAGRDVSADHHFKLCAALGFDPFIKDREFAPFTLGGFDRKGFGRAIRSARTFGKNLQIRPAAKAIGISSRALSFIENGRVVSVDAILAACRWSGLHPFGFAKAFTFTSAEIKPDRRIGSAA